MLPTFKDISPHATYALWHVTDSIEELARAYQGKIPVEISNFHPNKKVEFLASRVLIRQLCQKLGIKYSGIFKDDHGKPHLVDNQCHISISHSHPFVACLIDKQGPCGIDIETPRQQLIKIKGKFLNQEEQIFANDDLNLLCQLWCAKEALYKLYGRKKLIFSENISVSFLDKGLLSGRINIDGQNSTMSLQVEYTAGHFIVYTL